MQRCVQESQVLPPHFQTPATSNGDDTMIHLETSRLILRQFNADDAMNLFDLNSDPQVVQYTDSAGRTPDLEVIRQETLPRYMAAYRRSSRYGLWAATEKQTEDFVGWFMFRPFREASYYDPAYPFPDDIEVGYRLKRSAWGRGLATEGVRALVRPVEESRQDAPVMAVVMEQNAASIKVLEKSGLTLLQDVPSSVAGHGLFLYRLDRQEEKSEPAAG